MSQLKRNQFQLTFLAMAVLSLSACSTTSNSGGFDLGGIGDSLGRLGSKTAELGSNAWEGTKNVLHIGPQEPQQMDEVDLALMEDDAEVKTNQSGAQGVQLAAAEPIPVLPRNALKPNTAREEAPAFGEIPKSATSDGVGEIVVLASSNNNQEQPTTAAANSASAGVVIPNAEVPAADVLGMVYEVKVSENLWKIAKSTTGDANNWHRLADINNLAPNASVFPGQKLKIPADMMKTEINNEFKPVLSDVAEKKQQQPVTAATAQATVAKPVTPGNEPEPAVALNIPEAKPEVAVAAVEQKLPAEAAVEQKLSADAAVAAVAQNLPAESADAAADMSDAVELTVGDGETLWNFSKRTTGDATNWQTIALKNGFGEQQIGMIRPGQKIYVPINLIRVRDANGKLIAKGEENLVPEAKIGGATPEGAAPEYEKALSAAAAVLTGTNKPAEAPSADATTENAVAAKPETAAKPDSGDGDMKIVEAAFQDESGIKPVTPESLSEEASLAVDSNNKKMGKVMVKGSYYPKAVYNNADFSSSLLMRVSPGTTLLVSKAIGPWLEVKTEKGVGYVHSRDIK